MEHNLPLRITLVKPPAGVTFRVQHGKTDLLEPMLETPDAVTFDFSIRVQEGRGGLPNFLGPFTQGPPTGRFVYVNSGTMAGQGGSSWTRRAKVALGGITWTLIEEARRTPGAVIEARIMGRAGDGGPVCARTPLLGSGWTILPQVQTNPT